MSAQDPKIRLIEAVQAMRHSPLNAATFRPRVSPSQWMELCEAYDELIRTLKEEPK